MYSTDLSVYNMFPLKDGSHCEQYMQLKCSGADTNIWQVTGISGSQQLISSPVEECDAWCQCALQDSCTKDGDGQVKL